jgi:hypothetical protein
MWALLAGKGNYDLAGHCGMKLRNPMQEGLCGRSINYTAIAMNSRVAA